MIQFFDNEGETFDRYTMIERATGLPHTAEQVYHVYTFSLNCLEVDGINTYIGTFNQEEMENKDKEINFSDLPIAVRIGALRRLQDTEIL